MEAKARKGEFESLFLQKRTLNLSVDRFNLRTDSEGDWKG